MLRRKAFIPFLMAGDPDLQTTKAALLSLDEAGADVIELGVPYSVSLANSLYKVLRSCLQAIRTVRSVRA